MKITIAVLLVCIFFDFTIISAQKKETTEQKLTELRKNATEKLKSQSYRKKMTFESYKSLRDSKPYLVVNEITEFVPPDSSRVFSETKSPEGVSRLETITIAQRKYTRINNEDWKQVPLIQSGSGPGFGKPEVVRRERTVKYNDKGKKIINGQNADLYEFKIIYRYQFRELDYQNVITNRFWFSANGLFLRTESAEQDNNKRFTSRSISEYEYDPNIKIEAPIK
ncbi:MAG TPA: hypothetical protein VNB22_02300 [Pyrinomonadaceae bacterium]|nr:hypothetical protein [Pyrinomonadaceae bacterium]